MSTRRRLATALLTALVALLLMACPSNHAGQSPAEACASDPTCVTP